MQEDFFPAAEKILFDIENILKKNECLQSFEIVFANDHGNKSPVYHENNNLGLASWCVHPLYCYVYTHLMELRRNKLRREDPEIVARWLLGVLLLNPDANTFWNMRKELVRNERLDIEQELRFTKLVLYRNTKCFEAFSYRRLLINLLLNQEHSHANIELLLQEEINVATTSADRYSNNYHAWNHRQYIVLTYKTAIPENFHQFLISEWASSEKWCRQHISDYGGLSYRQFLLKRFLFDTESSESNIFLTSDHLIQRSEIISTYIKEELQKYNDISCSYKNLNHKTVDMLHGKTSNNKDEVHYERVIVALSYWIEDSIFNQNLISSFPGHESLWYHRRFLAYCLRSLILSYNNYSCYKSKFFEPSNYIYSKKDIENLDNSKSLLESAFKSQNIELLKFAKLNDYQNSLANNFEKFLSTINLTV
ncbi:protein prenyltransferase alpha subunit repeat-containing protein 1-A [Chelonus insularis]|uniref:protein prenyltransferase alpha subunit repeat-containing protein 1-A n=1 Tax=Chelonus insularis TaxID=460826 RepID=UPI00158CDC84|nr:protein prenyltransferase alpha subunit repeat-containing protein 1-A [Chelonus insularis]XP_034937359.1 protein prenyltransferase alpha subunit repeat-containing protein 1-A [Chelonus insularis]